MDAVLCCEQAYPLRPIELILDVEIFEKNSLDELLWDVASTS